MTDVVNLLLPLRPRRLRNSSLMRDLVADVVVTPADLVMPLFVRSGNGLRTPVGSMPGILQVSPDVAAETIRDFAGRGLRRFILFGVIERARKDAQGSFALDNENPVNEALRRTRDTGAESLLITDLCFCEYTDHGHCGVLTEGSRGEVDNDLTLSILGRQAVVHANCGADVVAPSGMMDGQVAEVRRALDEAGHSRTAVLSYAVKYASSFYGPFREAADGAPQFGDRRGYQMDYRRTREWRNEVSLDLREGADIVMVKPALAYLDIIRGVRELVPVPVAAYQVSGEYSMICAAAEKGWLDLQAAALESVFAIKRAGADFIVTYFAPSLLEWL